MNNFQDGGFCAWYLQKLQANIEQPDAEHIDRAILHSTLPLAAAMSVNATDESNENFSREPFSFLKLAYHATERYTLIHDGEHN